MYKTRGKQTCQQVAYLPTDWTHQHVPDGWQHIVTWNNPTVWETNSTQACAHWRSLTRDVSIRPSTSGRWRTSEPHPSVLELTIQIQSWWRRISISQLFFMTSQNWRWLFLGGSNQNSMTDEVVLVEGQTEVFGLWIQSVTVFDMGSCPGQCEKGVGHSKIRKYSISYISVLLCTSSLPLIYCTCAVE